jgi:hypothetical protein
MGISWWPEDVAASFRSLYNIIFIINYRITLKKYRTFTEMVTSHQISLRTNVSLDPAQQFCKNHLNSREMHYSLWNQNINCSAHEFPPLMSILSQMKLVRMFTLSRFFMLGCCIAILAVETCGIVQNIGRNRIHISSARHTLWVVCLVHLRSGNRIQSEHHVLLQSQGMWQYFHTAQLQTYSGSDEMFYMRLPRDTLKSEKHSDV